MVLHGANSFLIRRPTVLQAPFRGIQTFCLEHQKETRCWKLQRLSVQQYFSSSTALRDSIDHELRTPMKINGDLNGFLVKGELSNGVHHHAIDNNGVTHANGHVNGFVNGDSSSKIDPLPRVNITGLDVPLPTANGGYTHTTASKAKIAAANKGKTPWNKGRQRSEEEKAHIAAGVRARNRERFLQTLKEKGLTEEEYEAQKKEARRKKDAERRARRTERGGYRPTDETKAKISRILKEKHARGEIKPRKVDPAKVRRGFTHSEETKQKISESLRKRWADDTGYRSHMTTKMQKTYSKEEIRKKVSETLKKKWQDPAYREEMLSKMRRHRSSPEVTEEYREKISRAMKKKWQDAEYREKTLNAIAEYNRNNNRTPTKPRKARIPKGSTANEVKTIQPIRSGEDALKVKRVRRTKTATRAQTQSPSRSNTYVRSAEGTPTKSAANTQKAKKKSATPKDKKAKAKEPDGSVNRLREERRDLFDLLYGDDDKVEDAVDSPLTDRLRSRFDFEDEDLDSFDPYGLSDY